LHGIIGEQALVDVQIGRMQGLPARFWLAISTPIRANARCASSGQRSIARRM
jgi:hypothetical protein